MAIKFIFILVLLSGAISVTAFAGGGSPYDHGENHRHDSEGSAVGKPAAEPEATKTIVVTTLDSMRYTFSPQPDLKANEIVKFDIQSNKVNYIEKVMKENGSAIYVLDLCPRHRCRLFLKEVLLSGFKPVFSEVFLQTERL